LTDGIVLVGEIDDKIISYAVCFIKNPDNPLIAKRKVMFINAFGNDESYRNCGIGKRMMEYIFDYAKKKSIATKLSCRLAQATAMR